MIIPLIASSAENFLLFVRFVIRRTLPSVRKVTSADNLLFNLPGRYAMGLISHIPQTLSGAVPPLLVRKINHRIHALYHNIIMKEAHTA